MLTRLLQSSQKKYHQMFKRKGWFNVFLNNVKKTAEMVRQWNPLQNDLTIVVGSRMIRLQTVSGLLGQSTSSSSHNDVDCGVSIIILDQYNMIYHFEYIMIITSLPFFFVQADSGLGSSHSDKRSRFFIVIMTIKLLRLWLLRGWNRDCFPQIKERCL